MDRKTCDDCKQYDDKIYRFDTKPELPRHPMCRCYYDIVEDNYEKNVSNSGKSDIIKTKDNEMFRKNSDSRKDLVSISDIVFGRLTINARKKGAIIIRGTEEAENHLNMVGAAASSIGDILLFRKEVCISEVLEETYHFEQNLIGLNDDKPEPLRSILNEIDAKEYLINNHKKYNIPRKELELTQKQLEEYKQTLKRIKGSD